MFNSGNRRIPASGGAFLVAVMLTACGQSVSTSPAPRVVAEMTRTGDTPVLALDHTLNDLESRLVTVQAEILASVPYRNVASEASLSAARSSLRKEIAASHLGSSGCAVAEQEEAVVLRAVATAASGLSLLNAETVALERELAQAQQLSSQVSATAAALQNLLMASPAVGAQVDGDLLAAQLGATRHEQVLGAGVSRAVNQVRTEPAKEQRLTARAQYLGLACQSVQTYVSLTSSVPDAVASQPGVLTATVGVAAGDRPVQSGEVTFASAGRLLGTVPVGPDGVARLPLRSLLFGSAGLGGAGVGLLDVTATYSGDAYHSPSSGSFTQSVAPIPTYVQASETVADPTSASGVHLIVTIGDAAPVRAQPQSGDMTLWAGGALLATAPVGPNSRASLGVRPIAAGTYKLTLVYSGDAFHAPSRYSVTVVVAP